VRFTQQRLHPGLSFVDWLERLANISPQIMGELSQAAQDYATGPALRVKTFTHHPGGFWLMNSACRLWAGWFGVLG
jgi:hypothetical protein